MHLAIKIVTEGQRGCGYRDEPGAMYLRYDGPGRGCGKLPIPLAVCPVCGEGIRPSRAPRLLQEPEKLWQNLPCKGGAQCYTCPLADGQRIGPALLIWVGERYYPTSDDFDREADRMGISRRITAAPRDFVLGESWVLLAHRKAIPLPAIPEEVGDFATFMQEQHYDPGIFRLFRPTRIEVIVTGEEPDDVIEDYLKRGLTPVLVQRAGAGDQADAPRQIDMFEGVL